MSLKSFNSPVPVLQRTVVFTGLYLFVYAAFTLLALFWNERVRVDLRVNPWLATGLTALLITAALRPLEHFLSFVTDRFLFQKKYNTRELLSTFTHQILTVLDLQDLMEVTVTDLIRIMKLESAGILLHNKYGKEYTLAAARGIKNRDLRFSDQDVLIQHLGSSGQPILLDRRNGKTSAQNPLRRSFEKLNARLCLPLQIHDELIGVLFLGPKKSGEDYLQEDLDILSALSRTEAIAISNALLFAELSKIQSEIIQREKMAVIGALAAGINHEICNPLSIIRGECEIFLLNQRDNYYQNKSHEEMLTMFLDVMKKVVRETDRAAAITKRLSTFAKPSHRSMEGEVWIDKEIDEVLSLMNHDIISKNITINKKFCQRFPQVYADQKQVEEALFNVLRNSVQHSNKPEGLIQVTGTVEDNFAVVTIEDNGSGMPPEKIENILNPFYSLKEAGKATDLGLFIVKQIMEQLKGTIAVQSEQETGSVFLLKFPIKKS